MNETYVVAIIGAVATIAGPFATWGLSTWYSNRSKLTLAMSRRRAVAGEWRGMVRQANDENTEYNIGLVLEVGRKVISGTMSFHKGDSGVFKPCDFTVEGGFYHDQFLRLNYVPRDSNTIQFGSIVLCMAHNGKEMDGYLVGFGKTSGSIVSAAVTLAK